MSKDSSFTGKVIRGDNRGRSLGIPTANLELLPGSKAPPPGIYACLAALSEEKPYVATLHCGPRPTFPDAAPSIEVHMIDYPDRDLYGKIITCTELRYLRRIEHFTTIDDLVEEMTNDIYKTLRIFNKSKSSPSVRGNQRG